MIWPSSGGISEKYVRYINIMSQDQVPLVARFNANVTSGTAPLAVKFTDTSTNTPLTWAWSFTNVTGNNTQVWWSTVQSPTHTFGVGNYSIILNASNSAGYNLSAQVTFINVTAVTSGGHSTATVGIYRNGAFYQRNSNSAGNADLAFIYGIPGDTPLVGDWDGNGVDTVGIYRNGAFYLRNSNSAGNADLAFIYGIPGDTPLVGDWNGT